MKLVSLTLFVSSLMLAGIANAQADLLQAKGEAVILKACAACHDQSMTPSFVDANGEIISSAVKDNAAKISARVQSTTRPMPPKSAPASLQPSAQEKADLLAYTASLLVTTPTQPTTEIVPLSKLTVEPGFKIEVFGQAKGARSLAVHSSGIVFAGTGGFSDVDPQGRVYAIVPTSSGNKTVALASGLNNPNGIVLNGDDLFVAESTRVLLFKNAVATARSLAAGSVVKAKFTVIKDDIRKQSNHHWKSLAIGPDGKLYIPIGADCNVCADDLDNGAAIFRMNLDGSNYEQVARGVRNTVGLAFHPVTGQLWFTDNGRDQLGDSKPGDELNVAAGTGVQNFGFPSCFAADVVDPTFGKNYTCNEATFTKPAVVLGAHVAALGLTFYTGETFPSQYTNTIFIAEHGSWNSSKKVGYRLTIVEPTVSQATGKTTYSYRPFISGFATATTNWGRPVDVKNYIDGSLLLSDDNAGMIYKISPTK